MPKFSARTNGESRVGNFRRMMDALKSGAKPSPRVDVHDGRREVTADMEKVTEILWTGDATGKEYTSAELRAAGASDNVVRAYMLVRRELKKATSF